MEWYTLDDALRRDQVIEEFNSFIWTERYSAWGDFQIIAPYSADCKALLAPKKMLAMQGSYRVMIIDTVSDDTDENGERLLTVTGKSIEDLLDDRVAMPALADTTTTPNWVITGTPDYVANFMFHSVCVEGAISDNDTIPFFTEGQLIQSGNIPFPTVEITVTASPDTLYNSIKNVCDTYSLGFRLVRNGETGQIYFEIYTGNDLTTGQTLMSPVIFDPNLHSLQQISQLVSTAQLKTVAYVFASNGAVIVNAPGVVSSVSGADRRVLLVNSSNDADASDALTSALMQEGLQALRDQQEIYSFDGQLPPTVPYIYGVDYNLGDLVEERDEMGNVSLMLVTEQIFTSDDSGERSYPTLSLQKTVPSSSI
jgi:hypothetical protein